ncbi:MAG: DNA recombination protein RmuC [Bryobacterales bacterium]|nr:DNA recombination protein RmuC [Bryobacterales bacterium]
MDLLSIALFVALLLILCLLLWIALRPGAPGPVAELTQLAEKIHSVKADVERLDRVLREDREGERSATDERGRVLRQELLSTLADSRTELGQALVGARKESLEASDGLRGEMQRTLAQMGDGLRVGAKEAAELQRLELEKMVARVDRLSQTNTEALDKLRETLAAHLTTLRNENSEKLELMRKTVDEQLQGTLEKRLGESFKLVSERLEQVHRGLGEMQTLATGVGDLKRVLSNVKVRGTWGETQLANLLAQVFSADQYRCNVATRPGSSERVEFAIRLPGRGPEDEEVLLPIDAKFPREDYERLVEASEACDAEAVEQAGKALEMRIRNAAKDIRDKYIHPPQTTDFAFLFLPTEGLYAELLRRPGLADQLQSEYRVVMAGPTTLNALINSLQMGFRTLAIQRRSSEVWEILGAVKTEFAKYGGVLEKVQKKLQEASNTVDEVAKRHRAVSRKLRGVSEVSTTNAGAILGAAGPLDAAEDEDDLDVAVNRAGG